ncbi:ABC transporter ATP-binding protein [Dissulfuribacter thermophilus]|uniref:ABC transporter ATP-binding protein n=1 Tax=Dissulfuribacter thermophilus TaxID=1156395 RepID=UPI001FC99382|nr:ABC transporter ATP-binding protein [Dissulfuribacter thermophilus]
MSLSVNRAEVVGLLGPNGAGKTTFIKILATLIEPDRGKVFVGGYDVEKHPSKVRRIIGLVNTNERSFYWRLTGRQNLDFFATLYGHWGKEKEKRIDEALETVGLTNMADRRFFCYSTGQRQRLAIARALLSNARLILFDEPASSLDPLAASELARFTRNRLVNEQGMTVIWCTHNLTEAEIVSDRIAFMKNGRVVACGSLEEIRHRLAREETYEIEIEYDSLAQIRIEHPYDVLKKGSSRLVLRVKVGSDELPGFISFLCRKKVKVYSCRRIEMGLEEIFRILSSGDENWLEVEN